VDLDALEVTRSAISLAVELRHGGLGAEPDPLVLQGGGPPDEQPGGVDLGGMSASMNWMAWKLAMGWPKALRSLA